MQRNALIVGALLGGAILFGGGVALGLRWGGISAPAASTLAHEKPASDHKAVAKPLQVATLASTGTGGTPASMLSPATKDRLSMLVDLNKRLQLKYGTRMLMGGQLNEDFVHVFDLTAGQQQQLKAAIQTATDEIGRIEASLAKIEPRADGTFSISVPPYPQNGGEIYDQFTGAVADILGPERLAYAQDLHAIDFDRTTEMHQFGLWQINLEVRPYEHTSGWGTSSNLDTGVITQNGNMDFITLKRTNPFLYERMRAAGQVPADAHP